MSRSTATFPLVARNEHSRKVLSLRIEPTLHQGPHPGAVLLYPKGAESKNHQQFVCRFVPLKKTKLLLKSNLPVGRTKPICWKRNKHQNKFPLAGSDLTERRRTLCLVPWDLHPAAQLRSSAALGGAVFNSHL